MLVNIVQVRGQMLVNIVQVLVQVVDHYFKIKEKNLRETLPKHVQLHCSGNFLVVALCWSGFVSGFALVVLYFTFHSVRQIVRQGS